MASHKKLNICYDGSVFNAKSLVLFSEQRSCLIKKNPFRTKFREKDQVTQTKKRNNFRSKFCNVD